MGGNRVKAEKTIDVIKSGRYYEEEKQEEKFFDYHQMGEEEFEKIHKEALEYMKYAEDCQKAHLENKPGPKQKPTKTFTDTELTAILQEKEYRDAFPNKP